MRKFYLVVLILLSITCYANSSNTVNNSNREKLTTTNVENYNMEKLIKAIIHVESNGNIAEVSSDGECVGILQIKKIVVDDCNEYLKMKGKNKRFTYNDRLNKEKSIEMFYLIQERYKNFKMEYIEKGLMAFQRKYADYNITSIAFPKLGCGNGELDWEQVKPLMEKYLKELPIDIYIYLSPGTDPVPEHKVPEAMDAWLKEHAKDMSFTGVKDELVINSSIVPIHFLYKDIPWDACWDNKSDSLIFNNPFGKEIIVEEKTLQLLWDNIQSAEIFKVADDEAANLVYFLLASMGYLTSVEIQDEETNKFCDGYQLDAGSGRYFSIKG